MFRPLIVAWALVGAQHSALAAAIEGSAPEAVSGKAEIQKAGPSALVTRTHDFLSEQLIRTVDRVDQFFGDERLEDDNTGTRLSIKLGVTEDRLDGTTFNHRFSARVALPRLQNRLQVIADNWVEGGDPEDPSEIRSAFENSSPVTGLRWVIRELKQFRLTTDVGLRWSDDPQVLFRLRARDIYVIGTWELFLSETLFAYSTDGVGETTEMRWSHDLGSRWLFRSVSKITWRDQDRGAMTIGRPECRHRAARPSSG